MPTRNVPESQRRETRILLLIVVVSIALLMVLARLRYPAAELPVIAPTQSPLIGDSTPRGFDDLNERLTALLAQVSPRVVVVELENAVTQGRRRAADPEVRLSLAVRLRPDAAVMHLPSGWRPRALAGAPEVTVAGADEPREIVVLRVAPSPEGQTDPSPEPFNGMSYVVGVSPTRGGPTVQPVFVGRVNPLSDSQWATGLLDLGATPNLSDGSALFSTGGQLLGLVIARADSYALITTPVLHELVSTLVTGGAPAQ